MLSTGSSALQAENGRTIFLFSVLTNEVTSCNGSSETFRATASRSRSRSRQKFMIIWWPARYSLCELLPPASQHGNNIIMHLSIASTSNSRLFFLRFVPRSGELRTQKLKSHLVRTLSLNVLPLKSGVGQYIAMHATLAAGNVFLAYFYPSGPFTCIFFPENSPDFFMCWLWLTPIPV